MLIQDELQNNKISLVFGGQAKSDWRELRWLTSVGEWVVQSRHGTIYSGGSFYEAYEGLLTGEGDHLTTNTRPKREANK